MDKIDILIAYLFAIQAFAKDIHYSASGEAFYSKHLLADEIYKGIDEQIDAQPFLLRLIHCHSVYRCIQCLINNIFCFFSN